MLELLPSTYMSWGLYVIFKRCHIFAEHLVFLLPMIPCNGWKCYDCFIKCFLLQNSHNNSDERILCLVTKYNSGRSSFRSTVPHCAYGGPGLLGRAWVGFDTACDDQIMGLFIRNWSHRYSRTGRLPVFVGTRLGFMDASRRLGAGNLWVIQTQEMQSS